MSRKACRGFDLTEDTEGGIGTREVERWGWSIHVAGAKQAHAARGEVVHGDGGRFLQLSFDADSVLRDIGELFGGIETHDARGTGSAGIGEQRVGQDVLEQPMTVVADQVEDRAWAGTVVE